jgi:hypothetical protein
MSSSPSTPRGPLPSRPASLVGRLLQQGMPEEQAPARPPAPAAPPEPVHLLAARGAPDRARAGKLGQGCLPRGVRRGPGRRAARRAAGSGAWILEPQRNDHITVPPLRWGTRRAAGRLFPLLDADIAVIRAGAPRPPADRSHRRCRGRPRATSIDSITVSNEKVRQNARRAADMRDRSPREAAAGIGADLAALCAYGYGWVGLAVLFVACGAGCGLKTWLWVRSRATAYRRSSPLARVSGRGCGLSRGRRGD